MSPVVRHVALATVLGAVGVALMLWLAGRFSPKIASDTRALVLLPTTAATAPSVVPARLISIPASEAAVGTVQAVYEGTITAKLAARVVEVDLKAGQVVRRGDVLARLEDADLRARVQQAEAAASAARAVRDQAARDAERLAGLLAQAVASRHEYEQAAARQDAAEAELTRAHEAVNEAQALLGYTTLRAPTDGIVVDRRVEVGDTVMPGQVLLTMYDPRQMQLVASVRESLARRLQVGTEVGVRIEGLDKACAGRVSEIVPEAQAASRTFQVKVTGPCPPGVYSGMFGRLLIPLDEQQVLVVPLRAVRHVGQLELVDVLQDGEQRRRAVRSGRTIGDDVEVLSGLREGELVAMPVPSGGGG